MEIKEKYKGHKKIILFEEGRIRATWIGAWQEIRLENSDNSDENILLTIPKHGKWIQFSSTINSITKLAIINKLAKKALKEVFGREDIDE